MLWGNDSLIFSNPFAIIQCVRVLYFRSIKIGLQDDRTGISPV